MYASSDVNISVMMMFFFHVIVATRPKNNYACSHFARPGNAMKFDPLRCQREKKIARVSLAY